MFSYDTEREIKLHITPVELRDQLLNLHCKQIFALVSTM